MAISDAQYLAWLANTNKKRVILVEAEYSTGTEYMASQPFVSGPSDTPANIAYIDTLKSVPSIVTKIDASATLGQVEIVNVNGDLDSWLNRAWPGWPIRLYLGDMAWSRDDFRQIFAGIIAELKAPSLDRLSFDIHDKKELLNVVAQPNKETAGPFKNFQKPLIYGDVFNTRPRLIDSVLRKYRITIDALTSITDVRADGKSVGHTDDLPNGTFTLNAASTGMITADAVSSTGATAKDIITDLLTRDSVLTAGEIDTASLDALPTQPLNLELKDDQTIASALDDIMKTLGGYWRFDRLGKFQAQRLEAPGTSVLTIDVDDVMREEISLTRSEQPIAPRSQQSSVQPVVSSGQPLSTRNEKPRLDLKLSAGELPRYRIRLGFRRNWTPQQAIDSTVGDATRATFEREHEIVSATDVSGIKSSYPLAKDAEEVDTLFVAESDAQAEADRRLALRSVERRVFTVECFTRPFSIKLGDTITLDYPRYGFDGGADAVVIGLTEMPTRNRVQLELWK